VRGLVHDGGAVALRLRQDAVDPADGKYPVMRVDMRAEGADAGPGCPRHAQ